MEAYLEVAFLSLVMTGVITIVFSILNPRFRLVALSLSLRTVGVLVWLVWLTVGNPSTASNLLGFLTAVGLLPGLGRAYGLLRQEKAAGDPTHKPQGHRRHPIFLGRSSDGRQNPLCRTCGQTLTLAEFQKLQSAGLVVC